MINTHKDKISKKHLGLCVPCLMIRTMFTGRGGHLFNNICERHAPYRQVKVRQNSLPWITPQIRHLMNHRYKTFLRAKRSQNPELFAECRALRNRVTREVRLSKTKYYIDMFNEVKSCKSYWRLLKNAMNKLLSKRILGIKGLDGKNHNIWPRESGVI
jgi:hypothetical protein